jgi:hypothetical protein
MRLSRQQWLGRRCSGCRGSTRRRCTSSLGYVTPAAFAPLPGATHETKRWVKHDSDLDPIRSHPRFTKPPDGIPRAVQEHGQALLGKRRSAARLQRTLPGGLADDSRICALSGLARPSPSSPASRAATDVHGRRDHRAFFNAKPSMSHINASTRRLPLVPEQPSQCDGLNERPAP